MTGERRTDAEGKAPATLIMVLTHALALAALIMSSSSTAALAADPVEPAPELPDAARGKPVRAFAFALKGIDDEERARLERYVADLLKKPIDVELMGTVEQRIEAVRRYARAKCRAAPDGTITCDVRRARVLREVRIEGLPGALLESDLRKRVFLRPGEPIDEAETIGKSRLVRQRTRIEEVLEREGYYSAEVRLLVKKANERGEFDVVIRIRGGSFVEVERVDIKRFGPLSQRDIIESFSRMCFTSEGLFDGLFVGNIMSCFNKRRMQATVERLNEQLHDAGWPEGRVLVDTTFIDPARTDAVDCSRSLEEAQSFEKRGLKVPPRCVRLTVDVDAGVHVTARFHVSDGMRPIAETPELLRPTLLWLREIAIEPVSRGLQQATGAPPSTAADMQIVQGRLEGSLSFEEAGAVDETEVEVSAQKAEGYLATRGFVAPRVTVEQQDYDDGRQRVIDFTVQPSVVAAVRSVRLVGNKRVSEKEILDGLELASQPRSFQAGGAISAELLDDDKRRIAERYARFGFTEADVQASAELWPNGEVDVTFSVDEGDPFVLAGVVLAGGSPSITGAVLAAIRHCEGGVATKEKRPPMRPEDCAGAPLLPDELEADAQRVQSVYAGHGFPNVEAVLEIAFGDKGPLVRITVLPPNATAEQRDNPQPNNVKQVLLGEVFLEGNQVTSRDVLLREAGLEDKSGLPLDPVALGKGISRLRRSGLYDSVELEYLGLDGESDRAHVRLSVDERPAFTLDASLGLSTEQLLSFRTEARNKNLFGSMLDATFLVDLGLFVGRFSQTRTQLRWPRIFGSDVTASFVPASLSYADSPANARINTPSTSAGQKATASWELPDLRRRLFSAGTSFSLDWRVQDVAPLVNDKLTLGAAFELRYDWLNPAAERIEPFSLQALETIDGLLTVTGTPAAPIDPAQIATITPRIAFNNVDNPFDPKQGFGFDLFVRASTPPLVKFGPYGVFGASARAYATLGDRLTIAAGGHARVGVSARVDAPSCPEGGCEWALMQNDLLLLGGERSVRGVEEDQIRVLSRAYTTDLEPAGDDAEVVQIRPGLVGATGSIELRYALARRVLIGDLKPALFFDGGVSTDDFDFNFFPSAADPPDLRYAWSAGVGLRLVTPVGPLSIDLAYSPPRNSSAAYLLFGYMF